MKRIKELCAQASERKNGKRATFIGKFPPSLQDYIDKLDLVPDELLFFLTECLPDSGFECNGVTFMTPEAIKDQIEDCEGHTLLPLGLFPFAITSSGLPVVYSVADGSISYVATPNEGDTAAELITRGPHTFEGFEAFLQINIQKREERIRRRTEKS